MKIALLLVLLIAATGANANPYGPLGKHCPEVSKGEVVTLEMANKLEGWLIELGQGHDVPFDEEVKRLYFKNLMTHNPSACEFALYGEQRT